MRSLSLTNRGKGLTLVEPVREWTGIGMGTDGKFRVDGSAIKAGYKCSTSAALRYIWGLTSKSERANLLAGTAFHAAIAQHLTGQGGQAAINAFDALYKDWAQLNVAVDDRLAWANVRTIVDRYIEHHKVSGANVTGWPFQVLEVEIPFEVPLTVVDGVEIVFVGRLDILGRYNGYLVIDDHKSTGFINEQWTGQWAMDGQVSGYVWAARQLYNEPVIGAFITGIQFSKLPSDGSRKCNTHKLKYAECGPMHAKWETVGLLERNEEMIANWHADAVKMAEGLFKLSMELGDDMERLNELQQEGVFTDACRYCEFKKGVCEIGRRAGVARASLEFNPWNPLEV